MTRTLYGRPFRLRAAIATVFGALMATGVGLGIWVMVAGYSPVPFADFWGQFPFLERAVGGDLRIADLWAQANEHRILIPRLELPALGSQLGEEVPGDVPEDFDDQFRDPELA